MKWNVSSENMAPMDGGNLMQKKTPKKTIWVEYLNKLIISRQITEV